MEKSQAIIDGLLTEIRALADYGRSWSNAGIPEIKVKIMTEALDQIRDRYTFLPAEPPAGVEDLTPGEKDKLAKVGEIAIKLMGP